MDILVFNAGSSTLKFALFDGPARAARASGVFDWNAKAPRAHVVIPPNRGEDVPVPAGSSDHAAAVGMALHILAERGVLPPEPKNGLAAVGHRIVHGGAVFRESVRIDAAVKQALASLAALAPLHNPPALAALAAAEAALPGVPQAAVFDTSFFAHLPPRAFVYPLPYEWYTEWGIRRFGFHGISHAYCTSRAREMFGGQRADLRLVICHLGNGCSASAVRGTTAVATTMGFTPLEGLMMGTRSGTVDPGILLHVLRNHRLTAEQLDQVLNHKSGLLGVSGVSADFRQVESAANQENERARLALEIYADRIRATVGALAVTLGGVDGLVFTAGVGENSASLRATACEGLECLGLRLDPPRNGTCRPDQDVSVADSAGRILVLQTREELMIAREARRLLDRN